MALVAVSNFTDLIGLIRENFERGNFLKQGDMVNVLGFSCIIDMNTSGNKLHRNPSIFRIL
jgi:hypothetical protein